MGFVGIDLGRERVPDATTLLKFRRLLEHKDLGKALFAKVGEVLQSRGMKVGTGTIVDATIIGAPSSTKNADRQRDPEILKKLWGFTKVRYRGLVKNATRSFVVLGLANIYLARARMA